MKLTRKEYTDPAEKKKDFWRGVGLWFGLNIVMTLCSWGVNLALANLISTSDGSSSTLYDAYTVVSIIVGIVPLLINIGLIIYFAFTRSQIALGMLAGFGIALLLVLCLGVIVAAVCFVMFGNQGLGG